MEVEYRKKFLKEFSKLPIEYAKTIEEFIFDDLPNYSSLSDSSSDTTKQSSQ